MTKLKKVLTYVHSKGAFTRKDFKTKFGKEQVYETYLCYLKRAGYVQTISPGKYVVAFGGPSPEMSYTQLYKEAYP